MLLSDTQRRKQDESSDTLFYDTPRFVTHVDEGFIDQLTQLYRQRLQPGSRVLDMMSSWVSHLPEDVSFAHVEGHGMNEAELDRNPRLDHYFVQNLNENPRFELEDASFDAILNTVSVQYLQQPEIVFAEMRRMLKPGGIAIISFSNRMFPHKAIQAWSNSSELGRIELVKNYVRATPGFAEPEAIINAPTSSSIFQLFGLPSADPFYAVLAEAVQPLTRSTNETA